MQPENIMLVDPANGTIKLIDFGVARNVGGTKDVTVMVGTPEFAGRQSEKFITTFCSVSIQDNRYYVLLYLPQHLKC